MKPEALQKLGQEIGHLSIHKPIKGPQEPLATASLLQSGMQVRHRGNIRRKT